MVVLDSVWLITAIVINAIFMQMYFGPLFAIAGKVVGPEKTGISNGVSNTFANFGGLASILLMGILKDTTGSFEWGFYSICGIASIGLILTIILHKKYP
jgi:MFS-type transporter involved in bile tolerance (Atg22 family)